MKAIMPGFASLVLLALCSTAFAQAGSKESQKFLSYSEDARESITDGREQLQTALAHYNSLVQAEAPDPQSAYKGFAKALDRTEKYAAKTRERVEKMKSQAEKVFKSWQKELDEYQNDSLRKLSEDRLTVTRQRYDQMILRMAAAGNAYEPLILALRDQDLFMSRDLSAEALGPLAPMAAEVNRLTDELYTRIAVVLEEQRQDEAQLTAENTAARKK
jgi:hypothetical protein